MVTSVAELVQRGLSSPQLDALHAGDWYLIGSRSRGLADDVSDWDTVLFTDRDGVRPFSPAVLDDAFSVRRPELEGTPTLAFHRAWRAVGAVEIDVLGPADRRGSERSAPIPWAHSMRYAQPLHLSTEVGEDYRGQVAARFEHSRPAALQDAYVRYRLSRNEAVSALARSDEDTTLLLAGRSATYAARFWLLADGEPYPNDKWLLRTLAAASPAGVELVGLIRVTLDPTSTAADRFDAHWEVWQAVDRRAADQHIALS